MRQEDYEFELHSEALPEKTKKPNKHMVALSLILGEISIVFCHFMIPPSY
jgi:hypothetical protein